jgi:hypothetical protein
MVDCSPVLPGVLELYPRKGGKNVDPSRCNPDLINDVRRVEVLNSKLGEGCAERGQSLPDAMSVVGRWAYPDIQISGCPRIAVSRQGVCSDDEEVSVCLG